MHSSYMKVLIILCTAMLVFTISCGMTETVKPVLHQLPEHLGGMKFWATMRAYDEALQCFPVVLYDEDIYDKAKINYLMPGDVVIFNDAEHTVKAVGVSPMETLSVLFDDGEEILFSDGEEGIYTACSAYDDTVCMHVWKQMHLKPAEDITLTDDSDVEHFDPVITVGTEQINTILKEREKEGIGFDYSVTEISLNESEEIAGIHLFYSPLQ